MGGSSDQSLGADILVPTISPEAMPPDAPWLNSACLGDHSLPNLQRALMEISERARRYVAAVGLHEFAQSHSDMLNRAPRPVGEYYDRRSNLWNDWMFIGARSAVTAAFDFGEALDNARSAIKAHPIINPLADRESLKRAGKVFAAAFPQVRAARDAVSHPELFAKSAPKTFTTDSFPGIGEGSNVSVRDALIDGNYYTTFNGRTIACPLGRSGVQAIVDATKALFDSLAKAIDRR